MNGGGKQRGAEGSPGSLRDWFDSQFDSALGRDQNGSKDRTYAMNVDL